MVPEEETGGEGIQVELTLPEALAKPQFANYIHSNVSRMDSEAPLTTLTFVHVYPVPVSQTDSQPKGEVVARITLTEDKAIALRDLLIRQNPLTQSRPAVARGSSSQRRRR